MSDIITIAPSKRGRRPIDFSFPQGEFQVKPLAKQLGVSVPLVHLRMAEAGANIKLLRKERVPGRKGRSAGVYIYEPAANNP